MKIISCAQGSPEWYSARCGCITASEMDNIVTSDGSLTKPERRTRYMHRLIAERLTGKMHKSFQSDFMEYGKENEDSAVALYELDTGLKTKKVGFVFKEVSQGNPYEGYFPFVGCSPDRFINVEYEEWEIGSGVTVKTDKNSRGLELKNPAPWTHIGSLLKKKLPVEYTQQVQGSMWVTDLEQWDFMSNCDGLDPLIITVKRDDKFIEKLQDAIGDFIEQMQEKMEKLK